MTNPLIQRYEKTSAVCAWFHLEDWRCITLQGKDARDFLQRLGTADLRVLKPGQALQTLFLQGDGRMVADSVAVCQSDDSFILVTPGVCAGNLLALLDRFLFTEQLIIQDSSSDFSVGMLCGPESRLLGHVVNAFGLVAEVVLAPDAKRMLVLLQSGSLKEAQHLLYEKLDSAGGVVGDMDLYETLRIEAGCPAFGTDMTEKTIPLEAGLKPAISFTKGCFPGQEIVARINNLGHPANVLVTLVLPETIDPLMGRELLADDKVVGRITSTCFSPLLKRTLGLAITKWAYRNDGQVLAIQGDESFIGTVIPVPGLHSSE